MESRFARQIGPFRLSLQQLERSIQEETHGTNILLTAGITLLIAALLGWLL